MDNWTMRRNKHNNAKVIWKGKIDVEVARGVREEERGRGGNKIKIFPKFYCWNLVSSF